MTKKKLTVALLTILFSLSFLFSNSFSQEVIRPSSMDGWKEDILTLLSLVKRVGDYSEVVDLIEVAPALKEDPEIRKAFITFAPPGATPPEWAREEEIAPPVKIEVPEKIATAKAPKEKERREIKEEILRPVPAKREARPLTKEKKKEVRKYYLIGKRYYNAQKDEKAIEEFERVLALDPSHKEAMEYLSESHYHLGSKYYRDKDYGKAMAEFEKALTNNPEHKKAKEYFAKSQTRIEEKGERARAEEARRIAQEVAAQKEILKREAAPPEIIAIAEAPKEKERREREEEIKVKIEEELGAIPTPLPPGAKVIHSTDVVSGARAEMVEGKMRVTITLSGERKYTISERTQPPSIIIDIPHTINAIFPERIMVNQGCVRIIEVIQHRLAPMEEARVIISLSHFKEYEIKSKANEIYVEFEE